MDHTLAIFCLKSFLCFLSGFEVYKGALAPNKKQAAFSFGVAATAALQTLTLP